jgi:hypothetical protein
VTDFKGGGARNVALLDEAHLGRKGVHFASAKRGDIDGESMQLVCFALACRSQRSGVNYHFSGEQGE